VFESCTECAGLEKQLPEASGQVSDREAMRYQLINTALLRRFRKLLSWGNSIS